MLSSISAFCNSMLGRNFSKIDPSSNSTKCLHSLQISSKSVETIDNDIIERDKIRATLMSQMLIELEVIDNAYNSLLSDINTASDIQPMLELAVAAEKEKKRISNMSPFEQLKDHILKSSHRRAYFIMHDLSSAKLEEAIVYIDSLPTNIIRESIRENIKHILRTRYETQIRLRMHSFGF